MATIAKVTNGASSTSSLNYALGKNKDMHEDTEKWLKENDLQKQPEFENYRAVAMGGTNGIMPEYAKDQFRTVQQMYGQSQRKNQVLRITQSFAPNELSALKTQDWQRANNLGCELAQKLYPDYQSAVYTHIDGKKHVVHNHIIVNKVNIRTGKKLSEAPKQTVARLRDYNDKIAKRENWKVLEPVRERKTDTEIDLSKKHEYSYMKDLRNRIDKVLLDGSTNDFKSFTENLNKKGVIVKERGKNLSYSFLDTNNKQRRARGTRLGTDYEKETIKHELERRAEEPESKQQRRTVELSRETEHREPLSTGIDNEVEQREQISTRINKKTGQSSEFGKRVKSSISQFTSRLQKFAEAIPNFTKQITQRLEDNKLYKDVASRFKKDMAHKQSERKKDIKQDLAVRKYNHQQEIEYERQREIENERQRIYELEHPVYEERTRGRSR